MIVKGMRTNELKRIGAGLALCFASGCVVTTEITSSEPMLTMNTRSLVAADKAVKVVEKSETWAPDKTAVIICDMWDDHWCKGASRRVGELAVPMNAMIEQARQKGMFIIHAPSSVVDFYKGTPQRELAQAAPFVKTVVPLSSKERWGTTWCWPDADKEPDLPIDDSDMGCDCKKKCELREAWTRQNAILDLKDGDALTDHGQETMNLLADRGIDNVILIGVHLNMCVLGRPFGIRQMVQQGKQVVFMRDMTDTMYNSQKKPFVNHFEGTDLVVSHIEQYWCPSITSSDITGKAPFRFKEDTRTVGH